MMRTKDIFFADRHAEEAQERDMKSYQESRMLNMAYEDGRIPNPAKKRRKK